VLLPRKNAQPQVPSRSWANPGRLRDRVKIIDRYLLRQFFKAYIICFLSLTGIIIVFDAFTHLEDFLNSAEKAGGLGRLMIPYYAYRSILFFDRTSALLTLLSAMFTVAWIQRYNELTALQAAGISRVRVVKPIIVASILLSVFAGFVREVAIPKVAGELSRAPNDLMGDVAQDLKPRYDNETDVFIRGRSTYSNQKRIGKPNFWLPDGRQLMAENAYYQRPEGGRPGGYLLKGIQEPKNFDQQPSLVVRDKTVVISRRDAKDWLAPGECFVASNLSFDQLVGGQAFREFSSTVQLIKALRNRSLDYGADVRVSIHSRIVQPLLDVTLLFLGLPLVLARESRNVFLAMGKCLVVVSLFLLVVIGCRYMGSQSIVHSAALAAWLPLMLFVPAAVGASHAMYE
jgi:lipopolysaccharide export system permease protein